MFSSLLTDFTKTCRPTALVLLLLVGLGRGAQAQAPINDFCANAITLTSGTTCTNTQGTVTNATQSLAPSLCSGATATSALDVWYRFTAVSSTHLVSANGNFDGVLEVFSGSCSGLTSLACADNTSTGLESITLTTLTPGVSYLFRFYPFGGAQAVGAFNTCVTHTSTGCAAPTGAAVSNLTSTGATLNFNAVAGATSYTVTFFINGGQTGTGTITTNSTNLINMVPGSNYTVTVVTNCANGSVSTPASVSFVTPSNFVAPTNNSCASAVTLTPGPTCTPTSGTVAGATQSLAPSTCSGTSAISAQDVWYRFTATNSTHTISTAGAFDGLLELFSGTCTAITSLQCVDNDLPTINEETLTATGLTVGESYLVRYYPTTPNPAAATFTICVTAPTAPCANPTGLTVSGVTNSSATLGFAPGAGNVSFAVTYTPSGGGSTALTGTSVPVVLTGLLANTTYSYTLQSVCANGGRGTVFTGTFTTQAVAPPANDDPNGAISLTVTPTCTPTAGTNAGATTTAPNGYANPSTMPNTCGVAANPKDVWFSFVAVAPTATVAVTGNPAGLVRVFAATSAAGPFTQVACAAGANTNTVAGPVSATGLTAGTRYYVSVAGYGSGDVQGAFTICVTGVGTCNAVTTLAVGNITTTSASVSFTPGTGNTSYSVAYTPAGGATITLTANNSPVALPGLLPNTSYAVAVTPICAAGGTAAAATTTFSTTAPICNPVTNLAAGNITTTSASVSFTPGTGNTSYSVAYTPAGGATITLTANNSPVALPGLLPNTSYAVAVTPICAAGGTAPATTATFGTPLAARAALAGGTVSVFPNPAHQSFTVAIPAVNGVRTAQLDILNSLGQVVRVQSVILNTGPTQTAVDAATLAAGIYTVRVRAGSQTATVRLAIR